MPRRRSDAFRCHFCRCYLSTNELGVRYCARCEGTETNLLYHHCDNCYRRNFYNPPGCRVMILENILINQVSVTGFVGLQKHLCTFRAAALTAVQHQHQLWKYLCAECQNLLCTKDNEWKYAWPAYFWLMFATPENYRLAEEMWKYVPVHWRFWWVYNFIALSDFHSHVSLYFPEPYFEDITQKVETCQRQLASGRLVDLIQCSNDNCYCSVRCPWGCTEFVGDCGCVSLYVYLARFLSAKKPLHADFIGIETSKKRIADVFVGMRPDYLYFHDNFLDNEEWPIRPCIQLWLDKGPCLCTCKEHNGGSKVRYLHAPQNPFIKNLPAERSDQLAHAVLQPRFVKHMKFRRFNDMYDVVNCRGQYGGMDSCDITELSSFDSCGLLTFRSELSALFGRPDVKSRLDQLVQHKVIPAYVRDEKLAHLFLMDFDVNGDVRKATSGATYIPLKDALKFNKLVADKTSTLASSHFVPSWPSKIVFCHPFDDRFGSDIATIPSMKVPNEDLRLLWFMQSAVTYVPTLWECVNAMVPQSLTELSWHGWLLRYCCLTSTTPYFLSRRIYGRNGYRYTKASPSFKEAQQKIDTSPTAAISTLRAYSPCFSWRQVSCLLYSIQGVFVCVGKMEFLRLLADAVQYDHNLDGVTRSTEVLAILMDDYYDTGVDCMLPELVYLMDDIEPNKMLNFDLVYTAQGTFVNEEWDGIIFTKHAGFPMPSARQTTRFQMPRKVSLRTMSEVTRDASIVVYVRCDTETNTMRDLYMSYMGGNTKSRCPKHGFPLTTCPLNARYSCTYQSISHVLCHRAAAVECPIHGCNVIRLCREHLGASITMCEPTSIHADDESVHSSTSDEGSSISVTEYDYNSTCSSLLSIKLDRGMEESAFDHDQEQDYDMILGVVPGVNAAADDSDVEKSEMDISVSVSDDNVTEDADDAQEADMQIPTTNAMDTAQRIRSRPHKIALHVLLNEHGSLLIRRNNRLKARRVDQGFLERIIATSTGESIPLLYPEGMLFPSIFWKQATDGGIVGALPSGLLDSDKVAAEHGFASVASHLRCRLKNSSMLCSTDPRYIFYAFDCINNASLRGHDNRIVLRRGFEHMLGSGELRQASKSNDALCLPDVIDSRTTVNQLAAMIRNEEPTYFYTHTCNQMHHFGIAPIRRYLMKLDEQIMQNTTFSERDAMEMIKAYHQAAAVQITRTWMKVGRQYMEYICTSHEQPCGAVSKYWWKWEHNDDEGNLAHIHCILWLLAQSKTDPVELQKIQDRIKCSSTTFLTPGNIQSWIDEGLLSPDDETINDLIDHVHTIPTHSCAKAGYRCHRRVGVHDNETQCRVPNYATENPVPCSYGYVNINPNHSDEALQLFETLNLIERQSQGNQTLDYCFTEHRMAAGIHVYPARKDEFFIPCNPRLFVSHRSSDNLRICDTYMSSRYLAKYVQQVDEHAKVTVTMKQHEVSLQQEQVQNTKITTGKLMEEKREKKRKASNPLSISGRSLGLPEAVALILQEPQIYTNAEFVSVPTCPLEQRPAFERSDVHVDAITDIQQYCRQPHPPIVYNEQPLGEGGNIIGQQVRRLLEFPVERCFTDAQLVLIKDACYSPLSTDAITAFGVRPPELCFITSPTTYLQCFSRRKGRKLKKKQPSEYLLYVDLCNCAWIDGLEYHVRIRNCAIPYILQLPECIDISFRQLLQQLQCIALTDGLDANTHLMNTSSGQDRIQQYLNQFPDLTNSMMKHMRSQFIDTTYTSAYLPFPIYNAVKPTQSNRFIIHVLLSMGHFANELELFSGPTIKHFFWNAGLIPRGEIPTEHHVTFLVRRYILEQLLFIPGGTIMFDRLCLAAYHSMRAALLQNDMGSVDSPSYLYTSLQVEATIATMVYDSNMRRNLCRVLHASHSTPSEDELFHASKSNPLSWVPLCCRLNGQTEQSYDESCFMTQKLVDVITKYIHSMTICVRSLIICGSPGTGKTYQLQQAAAFCLAQGLRVAMTSLMSERAIALGGRHIHHLFCIPGRFSQHSVHKIFDNAIVALNRHPECLQFLRTLDVLCIDEAGYVAAEILNVMDMVMRYVRGNTNFMGGALVLVSMDHKQLPPIQGIPFLMSSLILTSFSLYELHHSVRARTDQNLQRLIAISREATITEDLINEFQNLIVQGCHHVESWDDSAILPDMIRILGKKEAMRDAERRYYQYVQSRGLAIVQREAIDLQSSVSSHGSWKQASRVTVNELNNVTREPQCLQLHKGLVIEMTFNRPGHWSNSQMGILMELPEQEAVDNFISIPLFLAPVGTKFLPPGVTTIQNLITNGWIRILVGSAPEIEHRYSGTMCAKRRQYGIRPRIAMTIHKAMGGDFGYVVSSVVDDGTAKYKLWAKEQVQVLISRTQQLNHLIFVGAPQATAQKLAELLLVESKYSQHMNHIVASLSVTETNPPNTSSLKQPNILQFPEDTRPQEQSHVQNQLPFRPCQIELPENDYGYVYLLLSLQNYTSTYIGQTVNLLRRLSQHNQGLGSIDTQNTRLRPWHCIAFITGPSFQIPRIRQTFERTWQRWRNYHGSDTTHPVTVMHLGERLVLKHNETELDPENHLRMVQCVEFTSSL